MPASPEDWTELWSDLKDIVVPLISAGWEILHEDEDEEAAYGASVFFDLRLGSEEIELELTEDRSVVVWRPGPSADIDDLDPPLFVIEDGTPEVRFKAFLDQGWVPAAPSTQ